MLNSTHKITTYSGDCDFATPGGITFVVLVGAVASIASLASIFLVGGMTPDCHLV